MILGTSFFVNPSDSVAMIAANAQQCIPYFKSGLKVNTQTYCAPSRPPPLSVPVLLAQLSCRTLSKTRLA